MEITLESVRSKKYEQNLKRYGESCNSCFLCGKPIERVTFYVRYSTEGNLLSHGSIIPNDKDQGLFPIGSECKKHLPGGFLHLLEVEVKTTTIETVKKGDFFRFPGKKTVYVKDGYNRELKKYDYYKWSDISAFGARKKGTIVEVEFDF